MSIGPIGSMINFGHSIYDINGNKHLKTNFETLEVQDFTNIFWNFIRGGFPEQIPCFLAIWGQEVYRFAKTGLASLQEAQLKIVVS